jgi:hypothetical protein
MMAGWANQAKRVVQIAAQDVIDSFDQTTGGAQGRVP